MERLIRYAKINGVEPNGSYISAIESPSGHVMFSGIKAWDLSKEWKIEGDIEQQTIIVLSNLERALSEIELSLSNIARVTCYLKDIADYEDFDRVFGEFFSTTAPARSVISGTTLRNGALVEMVADAFRGQ